MAGSQPDHPWPLQVRGLNFYTRDRNLQRFLERSMPSVLAGWARKLEDFGQFCGEELDAQAGYSDRIHPPILKLEVTNPVHPDQRKGHVYLNPRYEAAQQETYRRGFLAACFDPAASKPAVLPFVAQYLICKSDVATGCPFAMTHPVALLIDRYAPSSVKARFLPELRRMDGHTPVGGTWATEKHSGSDIGNTKTRAIDQGDGKVVLAGDNWFTSAIGFSRFLAVKTARPDAAPPGGRGLGLYLVPSHIDPAWQIANQYDVRHLKEKIGTRGLPTGEITLSETQAWELAPAGKGLKILMEALSCSRVHNAMAAAGMMHRALMESLCWASHRAPFGKPLLEQPMIQKRILDLQTLWLSGSALAFEAVRAFQRSQSDPEYETWSRVATALAKYQTAEQAVWCTRKALELVGGNGYTEEYPVARLFRDAQVLTVWEGPEQIQALELMRLLTLSQGGQAYLDRLSTIAATMTNSMTSEVDRLKALAGEMQSALHELANNPEESPWVADEYLHQMAQLLAYALMCEEAAWEMEHCQDAEKVLFAGRFYERTFINRVRPALGVPLLQREFGRVITGQGFAPSMYER